MRKLRRIQVLLHSWEKVTAMIHGVGREESRSSLSSLRSSIPETSLKIEIPKRFTSDCPSIPTPGLKKCLLGTSLAMSTKGKFLLS